MHCVSAVAEATMRKLLVLLIVLTVACGMAAGVTITLAPAYADNGGSEGGY